MKALARVFLALLLLSVAVYGQHDDTTTTPPEAEKSEKTELVDEFGRLGDCELRSRFDTFFFILSMSPTSTGYVLIYQGADVLPAYYGAPAMERVFRNHLAFRNFDPNKVVIVPAGFRQEGTTQLWIVPPGGEVPQSSDTIEAPTIPTAATFLYDESSLDLDYSEDGLTGYELPSVKAEHEAARAEQEEEERQIPIANESGSEDGPPSEQSEDDAVEKNEEYIDSRTPEEIDAVRFHWISGQYGDLLAEREDSTGVIIFYAGDQQLDISRLAQFIEEGKWRLATAAKINADRITVQFGGYRDYSEVEYWVVPLNGEAPVATPTERPVEDEPEV